VLGDGTDGSASIAGATTSKLSLQQTLPEYCTAQFKDSNNEARAPVSAEPHLEASLPTAGGNAQELMGEAPASFISLASPDNSSERSPDEAATDSPKLELVHDSARDEAANTIASM